jgi:pimeloyl-ACP methyl ester carboxylesterase
MPGEGESSFDSKHNYAPKYQVERLREFIINNNLEKIVLIGSSIGGCVASMYADFYPENVTKLIAIAPAGIKSPSQSKMLTNFIETREHPFAYKNIAEMIKFWDIVFYKTPKIANFLKITLAKRGEMRHKKINKIIDDFYQDGIFQLHDKIINIKTDTMIIWGKNDNIFDVSSASEIKNIRPQFSVKIIDESGHVPYLEKGHQVLNEIDNFIKNKIQ